MLLPLKVPDGVVLVSCTVRLVSVLPVRVIWLFELPNVSATAEASGAPVRLKLPITSNVPFAGRVAVVLGTVKVNWPGLAMFGSPEVRFNTPAAPSGGVPGRVTADGSRRV